MSIAHHRLSAPPILRSGIDTAGTEEQVVAALSGTRHRRESLAGALPELLADASFERLLALLRRQRLLALLGGRLLETSAPHVPDWFREAVAEASATARRRGLYHHALSRKVAGALGAEEIPVAPLKGSALADALYGDIGARESADIDLLVPAERLHEAAGSLERLGWSSIPQARLANGLPGLHLEMHHPAYPPVELHWRVHWYEEEFARAALLRAPAGADGWRCLQPGDQGVCLLLFYARDGFAGLRQAVDVATWWDLHGDGSGTAGAAAREPALALSLAVAAQVAEDVIGVPAGLLFPTAPALPPRGRLAYRLANPWLVGDYAQIAAEVSMVDGLLAPRGGRIAFVNRQLVPPVAALRRREELAEAPTLTVQRARFGHMLRVLGRYLLAARRLRLTAR